MSKKSVLKLMLKVLKEMEKEKRNWIKEKIKGFKFYIRKSFYTSASNTAGELVYEAGYLDCIRDLRFWIKKQMESEGGD